MATSSIDARLERISLEVAGSVAHLTLHNPPLNVIDIRMMEELDRVLSETGARTDVAVVVLSGRGEAFSAGVDVAAHSPDKVEEMLTKFHAAIRTLVSTSKITIARVHGHSLGGGAELAMVCDFVITADEANARKFLRGVDSAAVYWNASTRFTDGGEFGFGAEMGISTQKLHCRGPFALTELTSYKYEIVGTGQIRS